MFAAHNKVDNLIGIVDWNGQQIDGSNDDVLSLGDLVGKWETFGWKVMQMDGHNMNEMISTIQLAQAESGKGVPTVILMKTVMGQGVDYMMGTHAWHGKAPNEEQINVALGQLEETLGDYKIS